jgi:subtilisin family serine protease
MSRRLLHLMFFVPLAAAAAVPGQYIVELAGDSVAVHIGKQPRGVGIRSQAALDRRARIHEQRRPVRARLEAAQAEILDGLDTVANAFIVRIPDERAPELASIPGVLKVYPVRTFKLSLDHALPLHRVPEAWQQVGLGAAGAGMKIGIIDTGIDSQHPGFQDPSLPLPAGFPRANSEADLAFTNNKVIVARSYASLFRAPESDATPRDHVGHGTATAMAAAGVTNTGPLASITGVAPKAYLGSYKVFGTPGVNDGATSAALLKAIDDAVADGMDVLNLSLGSLEAPRVEDDVEAQALERAAALGVLIMVAAGNDGPDPNTISSPATAPSVIAVGASKNDRVFAGSVSVAGANPVQAVPRSGGAAQGPVAGQLVSVSGLDPKGLACEPLPDGSLAGRVVLILRGDCTFEVKLNNAQRAGAVAAVVYTQEAQPEPVTMAVGTATLPASMIAWSAGSEIERRLAQSQSLPVTLSFTLGPVMTAADGLVSFSSKGPGVGMTIKPDLVSVGTNFYTAAQRTDRRGGLYDLNGYTLTQGTSFSSPLLAGAAAVLKAARPGLTAAQYRSLLINTAGAWSGTVQQTGAGILNLSAALRASSAAAPVSLSFLTGGATISKLLTISNVGAAATTFRLMVAPSSAGPAPVLSADSLRLERGASAQVTVSFNGVTPLPGQYEGWIRIADISTGLETRVPYWYAVSTGTAGFITVLEVTRNSTPGRVVSDAVLFRVTDAFGIPVTSTPPVVSVSGDSEIISVNSRDRRIPGAYGITIRLGTQRGANVIQIESGGLLREVTI